MSRFIYCYAEFQYAECHILSVVWLNVVMLSVVAPFSILHKHQTRMKVKVTNPLAYYIAEWFVVNFIK